jgi:hypothetical protein
LRITGFHGKASFPPPVDELFLFLLVNFPKTVVTRVDTAEAKLFIKEILERYSELRTPQARLRQNKKGSKRWSPIFLFVGKI